ncbi:TonB-dependent receptor [Paracoccus sp. PS-1]|uniref:TonB-dependent receptor domain-containing protein n=1 Tax=unclassified Paracoccus (in: a-proteobacteria) TaxID=2688777 RepID=UPI0004911A18|nr:MULTISPECIES: TonB-dependent receptor [unclassified Paracoccus (in: a-proteobacteria)]MDQ7260174.1 TonB-dependent receptor [Paracoccus sp. PS1]
MKMRRIIPLAGVSSLALATALYAQEGQNAEAVVLNPITLIADGQENVEATGGVSVTPEDIEAMQPADVSELFARDSAITVSGGAGPSKRIHVFGMEQSNLAVTVDGVPQGPTSWHHTGSNVVDPAFLKSVEVEAGAAAADAGFGAAAGALRYETVGAKDLLTDGRTQGGRVGLSYGSNGRGVAGSLAGYGVYEGFDWFAMVHGANGDNYEAANGREMPGTEPATRGALLKLGYEFDTHRVELSYDHSKDDADRVIKMNMDLNADDAVYPLKVTRNTLKLKYSSTAPTDAWDPEATVYVSRNEYWRPNYALGDLISDDPGASSRPNGDMILETTTIGGVLKNTYTLDQGRITAGIDWQHDDYHIDNYGDHSAARTRPFNLDTMQIGTFVQGRFAFDNGIDLSTGLRLDHHRYTDWNNNSYSDTGASVNGTISYEFAEGYEVFAGASRTWLGYEIGEYGLLHARNDAFTTDPDYEPATARNVKLGLNANQGNWTGNITFFDTRLDGLAEYDVASGYLTNADEYRSKGFTLQGSYTWGSGRIGASFTKADVTQNGEDKVPDGGTVMPVGKLATLFIDQEIPQYNLKVGGTVEWAGSLNSGSLVDESGAPLGFEDHDSYTIVNVYGQWRPQNYENVVVHLGVDNLFDESYYERSSYVERVMGSRIIDPLYAPGRTVTLGVKMDF